jgi:DNA-binding NtrC family response regulator
MNVEQKARILLVDDEAAITRLMQTYLTRLGYHVDASLDATGAFELVKPGSTPYDLLVADLTLPDMPGQQMALRMAGQNERLRVLFCSGYPFSVDSLDEQVQPRCASLLKPFLPNMLAEAINELLNRTID